MRPDNFYVTYNMKKIICLLILSFTITTGVFASSGHKPSSKTIIDTATFATGCFWCTEAKFKQLKGVKNVVSGFTGGHVANPTYEQVSTGTTGHAEACDIFYVPCQLQ